jgi:hypothetical protein
MKRAKMSMVVIALFWISSSVRMVVVAAAIAASASAVATPPWITPSGLPSSARAAISYTASPRPNSTSRMSRVSETGERSFPALVCSSIWSTNS